MAKKTVKKSRRKTKAKSGVDELLARNGGLSYLEIPAVDGRVSAAFYETVFGWKVVDGKSEHPKFFDRTGHLLGRWVKNREVSRKPGLLPYIYVDRIRDAVKSAVASGGEVFRAVYAEGNLWVAIIRDPAGNVIGLWQESGRGK